MTPLIPRRETDLDWTAFRYVAGDLDNASRADFEERLDHDQAAREAVAAAVEVVGAVRLVAPEAAPTPPVFRYPALWGLGAALAASLLVWFLPAWLLAHHRGGNELALAWSDLRAEAEADPLVEAGLDETGLDEMDDDEGPVGVPDWMIEVVAEPSSEPDALPGR